MEHGEQASEQILQSIGRLEEQERRQRELMGEAERFAGWMKEKEAELKALDDSDLTPDERLKRAKVRTGSVTAVYWFVL